MIATYVFILGFKSCLGLTIFMLIFSIVVTAVLFGTVHMKFIHPPRNTERLILEGSTVLLKDYNNFFYKSISVSQDAFLNPSEGKYVHIDLFLVDSDCDTLKPDVIYDKTSYIYLNDMNISSLIPFYVLKGSTFEYSVAALTNESLENKFLDVCICVNSSLGGEEVKIECVRKSFLDSTGKHLVDRNGYYFFKVKSSDIPHYQLNVTATIKYLHMSTEAYSGCSLNASNTNCTIMLPFELKRFCLIAKFYKSSKDTYETELDVQVESLSVRGLLVGTLPLLLVYIAFLISLVCSVFCYCRLNAQTKVSRNV